MKVIFTISISIIMRTRLPPFSTLCFATSALVFGTALAHTPEETTVKMIALTAPWNAAIAEYSGLTWCDDKLVLLPQYPKRLNESKESRLPFISKKQIRDYLQSDSPAAIEPQTLLLEENGLRESMTHFDGFEAIACHRQELWIASEVINLFEGYETVLAKATIDWAEKTASIDSETLVAIESQSGMVNKSEEALTIYKSQPLALHEVNDSRLVKKISGKLLDTKTNNIIELDFPSIAFRITDATSVDEQNRFWVMNYKYSGDDFSRNAPDEIANLYGLGESHKRYYNLERLLEVEITSAGIELVEQAPIQLKMDDVEGRNWEGLVRFENRGFLMVTDKHPKTLFGFAPFQ